MKLELTTDEARGLLGFLDSGIRQGGLEAANIGLPIAKKIKAEMERTGATRPAAGNNGQAGAVAPARNKAKPTKAKQSPDLTARRGLRAAEDLRRANGGDS